MRRLSRKGVCIAAVLSLSGLCATAASAAEYELTGLPEIGRCVSVAKGTGKYAGRGCVIHKAAGKGNFEWMPGPGAKPKFEASGGEAILQGPKSKVLCSPSTLSGEYLNGKTVSVAVDLIGCTDIATKKACQSGTKNTEIEATLEGEIGFIRGGSKPQIGLDLKPKTGTTVFSFTCGAPPETSLILATVEGSAIGQVKPINRMLEEYKEVRYKVAAGKQVPEKFEGGVKDTLMTTFVAGLATTKEETTLSVKFEELVNEEPMEIKARQVEK